jgi:hypothetical protein
VKIYVKMIVVTRDGQIGYISSPYSNVWGYIVQALEESKNILAEVNGLLSSSPRHSLR